MKYSLQSVLFSQAVQTASLEIRTTIFSCYVFSALPLIHILRKYYCMWKYINQLIIQECMSGAQTEIILTSVFYFKMRKTPLPLLFKTGNCICLFITATKQPLDSTDTGVFLLLSTTLTEKSHQLPVSHKRLQPSLSYRDIAQREQGKTQILSSKGGKQRT